MNIELLKSLAVRLRGVMADHGVAVSHRQALDLIAAVPGLRDWSEAVAFPVRVKACRFDADAVVRIEARVLMRHRVPIRPEMLGFGIRQMSLLYRRKSASPFAQRMIVTSTFSGAGHVMQAGIAAHVVELERLGTLVSGPVPPGSGPTAFFAARDAAFDQDPSVDADLWNWHRAPAASATWREFLALSIEHERVELWIDPDPDAQLHLFRTLTWLSEHPAVIGKLYLVHLDDALGERTADDDRTTRPHVTKVDDAHIRAARLAWNAYRRASPVPLFELLTENLAALPHLRRAVSLLLGELPDARTALGATERLLLQVVEPGSVAPFRFMKVNAQRNPERVFGGAEAYRVVNRLAGCLVPAIVGLADATFGLGSGPDPERHRQSMRSELSLSDLRAKLLAGTDDFARHNPVRRWWGGTLLTPETLWRWDAERLRLIPPR